LAAALRRVAAALRWGVAVVGISGVCSFAIPVIATVCSKSIDAP
jgi:hypothetical protein